MITYIGDERANTDALRLVNAFRRRRFRSHTKFAEDEIIIPSGPYADQPFRISTQPFSKLFYDEIDTGYYSEIVVTGPSQSGKTLLFWVIPVLRTLFELCETLICAVPDMDMVADKLEQDIEPVLRKTRYWRYMPAVGRGSKGGRTSKIRFKHGPELRWMTAGGGDKARAAYTARVIAMTETDGFDVQQSTSTESTKIAQIEARQRSWKREQRLTIKEGTLTVKTGHTWSRIQEGTASRLALKCPHCEAYETPERDSLIGWKDAKNDLEAELQSAFFCPACGERWTEEDRIEANRNALLVHRGQDIIDGRVVGARPETRTLGLRWSAVNNLLIPAGNIGADEYRAARSTKEDAAQREMCQFVWAVPYEPVDDDNDVILAETLARRVSDYPRGQYPDDAELSLGIDVGKSVLHWTVIAMQPTGCGFIIDYGKQGLRSREIGFQQALSEGMKKLASRLSMYPIKAAGVDSRWRPDDVASVLKQLKDRRFRAFVGCGKGQFTAPSYYHPSSTGGDIIEIGTEWYAKVVRARSQIVINANANFWKQQVQCRVDLIVSENDTSARVDGPIRLYQAVDENEHLQFCRQLLAEVMTTEHDPKRGLVTVFKPIRSANHWLDSTSISLVISDKLLRKRKGVSVAKVATAFTESHGPKIGGRHNEMV